MTAIPKVYFPPTPNNYRKNIRQSKRQRVYKRDGYRCRKCGSRQELTIDHIRPIRDGGTNAESNLQTLCFPCNHAKGKKEQARWFRVWVDWSWLEDGRIWTTRVHPMPSQIRVGQSVTLYDRVGFARPGVYLGYCQTGLLPPIYWFQVTHE